MLRCPFEEFIDDCVYMKDGKYCDSDIERNAGNGDAKCYEIIETAEKLQDKLQAIKNWVNAYPVEIFPEPDFAKAHRVLKENGMTLDAISASSMRHVLSGIKDIIDKR